MNSSRHLPFLIIALVLVMGCTSAPISSNSATPSPTTNAVPPGTNLSTVLASFTSDTNASLQEIDRTLVSAATDIGCSGLTGPAANATLERLAAASPHSAGAITITPEGRIAAAMPPEYWGAVGINIADQAHVRKSLQERQPLMSMPFPAVEGFEAVAIQRPVMNDTGAFLGLVSIAFEPSLLLGDSANRSLNGTCFTAWAIDTDGRLLYNSDDDELVGHNLLTDPLFADYPELRGLAERMVVEPTGSGSYTFNSSGGGPAVTKDAVWGTAGIHRAEWRLVVAREV